MKEQHMHHVNTVLEFLVLSLGMIILLVGWMYRIAKTNAAKAYDYTKDLRPVKATVTYTKEQADKATAKARDYLAKREIEKATTKVS